MEMRRQVPVSWDSGGSDEAPPKVSNCAELFLMLNKLTTNVLINVWNWLRMQKENFLKKKIHWIVHVFFTFLHLWQPEFIWNSRFITKVNSVSPFVTLAHGGLLGVVVLMRVCFNVNQVVVVLLE